MEFDGSGLVPQGKPAARELRRAVAAAVRAILLEAEAEITARGEPGGAVCKSSGRCCKFESWGHRLYVTGAEAIYFEEVMRERATPTAGSAARPAERRVSLTLFFAQEKVEGCPYQVAGLCTARDARPLGCRVYFCDERAQGWLEEVYEKYHAKLKAVHETYGVPYEYLEWRQALRQIESRK